MKGLTSMFKSTEKKLERVCSATGKAEDLERLSERRDIDIHTIRFAGRTPLHICCENGFLPCVRYLTEELRVDLNSRTEPEEYTALHMCTLGGHHMVASYLLDRQAILVDEVDLAGNTPLHYACEFNLPLVVEELLKGGADITIMNKAGETPISKCPRFAEYIRHLLIEKASADQVHSLPESTEPFLQDECQNKGKWSCMDEIQMDDDEDDGVDLYELDLTCDSVEEKRSSSRSPRRDAIDKQKRNEKAVSAVLSGAAGLRYTFASPEKRLERICTVTGKVKDLQALTRKKHFNIHIVRIGGKSPFHLCCANGYLECVKYLVEVVGVNVGLRTEPESYTGLHMAALGGHHVVAGYLLSKRSIGVNEISMSGDTALHIACERSMLACVEVLLQAGANTSIRNKEGQLAFSKCPPEGEYMRQILTDKTTIGTISHETSKVLEKLAASKSPKKTGESPCSTTSTSLTMPPTPAGVIDADADDEDMYEWDMADELQAEGCLDSSGKARLSVGGTLRAMKIVTGAVSGANGLRHKFMSPEKRLERICTVTGKVKDIESLLMKKPEFDVHAVRVKGRSALHLACEHGHLDLVKYLVENIEVFHGARTDPELFTPLHMTAFQGHYLIASYLISRGAARLNEEDFLGNTPLHIACAMNQVHLVEVLLQAGATTSVRNNAEELPIDKCISEGTDIRNMLQDNSIVAQGLALALPADCVPETDEIYQVKHNLASQLQGAIEAELRGDEDDDGLSGQCGSEETIDLHTPHSPEADLHATI